MEKIKIFLETFRYFISLGIIDLEKLINNHKLIRRGLTIFLSIMLFRLLTVIITTYSTQGIISSEIVTLTISYFGLYSVITGFYFYSRNSTEKNIISNNIENENSEKELTDDGDAH